MKIAAPLLQPKLGYASTSSGQRFVDTTGDLVDHDNTLMIPKANAETIKNANGQDCVVVVKKSEDGMEQALIPRSAFKETGDMLYLPTYKDSPVSAAMRGGVRGMICMTHLGVVEGAMGGISGAIGGLAGALVPTDSRALKLMTGAAAGAATLAAGYALIGGVTSLPVTLMLGAVTGVTGVLGGSGEAKVRDNLTGGMLTGVAAGVLTGNPFIAATGGAAAGLGGNAKSRGVQVLTAAAVGAALGAAEAVLTHNSIGLSTAITAAVGAAGALMGPPLMQASRNLSNKGSELVSHHLGDWAARQSDLTMTALGAVPGAASGAMLGSLAAVLEPNLLLPAAAIGATIGGAVGVYRTHQMIAESHKRSA